jgi:hypothetical protein
MSSVPFSNPAGNNQTNPVSSLMPKGTPSSGATGATNPFMPSTGSSSPTPRAMGGGNQIPSAAGGSTPNTTGVPNVGGLGTTGKNVAGDTGAVDKQLTDIYGKGVGGALAKLLEGMSGTDSQVLQDYIKSLQPQMATAQANTNAALGAGGVSANSSVAAIADANLQAQETAAVAGESAKLTMNQEELTASILGNMQGAASKEVATSGWNIFGDVMSQITGDIGNLITPGAKSNSGTKSNSGGGSTAGPAMSAPQLPFGADSSMSTAPAGWDTATSPGIDMAPFS